MKVKLRNILSHPLTMISIAVICLALWLTNHVWWIVPFGLVVSALAGYAWKWEGLEEDWTKSNAGYGTGDDIKWETKPLDAKD